MTRRAALPNGVGLGLRWEFLEEVADGPKLDLAFFEVSPENYMRRGGYFPEQLERVGERYPIVTHGLTLSIGGSEAPEPSYLAELRREVQRLGSPWHSDHLCFSSAAGRALHELLPVKFGTEALTTVRERAHRVEDALGVRLALENISYYAHPGQREMPEAEFVARAVDEADVGLILDVNNAYVNALNHGGDARDFLRQMPLERVVELHVAGHARRADGLCLDTHGSAVCEEVRALLAWTLELTGPVPVLLERDNDVPPLAELLQEVRALTDIYDAAVARFEERDAARA